ncbi:MAG: TRAP transporter small permease [Leptospirales bacterium]|nr:TRAP transporter small permease [Leptospirales bacterium]
MKKFEKIIVKIVDISNKVAAVTIVFIMLLTSLEVILRIFRVSVTGSYELVGLFNTLAISFSLGYTTLQRGHIAVDLLVRRLSFSKQRIIKFANTCIAFVLFAIVTWRTFLYAIQLKKAGEVSATLQFDIYPFVFGLTIGCFLLCFVLLVEGMRIMRGADPE